MFRHAKKLYPMVAVATLLSFTGEASALPVGWSCVGTCGEKFAADGDVTLAPGFTNYQWISTNNAPNGQGKLPVGPTGQETNGSFLKTPTFNVVAGDSLNFYFNYITTDGVQYTEYAWAGLYQGASVFDSYLFTARTTTSGDTVPGNGLPGLGSGVTLTPSSSAIIPGGPDFSPLGNSGGCYGGVGQGCGYTGWIKMNYTFTTNGLFSLGFGVTNALDTAFQSAFAIAGVSINDVPIGEEPSGVPEPESLALLALAISGMGIMRKRKSA